jgi:hypothetical protein
MQFVGTLQGIHDDYASGKQDRTPAEFVLAVRAIRKFVEGEVSLSLHGDVVDAPTPYEEIF